MKYSTYYFHMKTKILADFQISISVPLTKDITKSLWMRGHMPRNLYFLCIKKGHMRYTRLILGISAAAEIYQREIDKYWVDRSCQKHLGRHHNWWQRLFLKCYKESILLARLRAHGISVNLDKCKFFQSSVTYMGQILSA